MTNATPGSPGRSVPDQIVATDTVKERYLVLTRQSATSGAIDTPPAYRVWASPLPTTNGVGGGRRLPPPPDDEHWGGGEGDDESASDESFEVVIIFDEPLDARQYQFELHSFTQSCLADHELPQSDEEPLLLIGELEITVLSLDHELSESDDEPLWIGRFRITDIEIKDLPEEAVVDDEL